MGMLNEIIYDAMKEKDLSYGDLAKMTGIPKSALQRYGSGFTEKISAERFAKICRALNLSEKTLYSLDYFQQAVPNTENSILGIVLHDNIDVVPKKEDQLLNVFRLLNEEGQHKVMEYLDDLVHSKKYKIADEKGDR